MLSHGPSFDRLRLKCQRSTTSPVAGNMLLSQGVATLNIF